MIAASAPAYLDGRRAVTAAGLDAFRGHGARAGMSPRHEGRLEG